MSVRNVVILGSTGSIGVNALDVAGRHPDRFRVLGLAAHSNADRLIAQVRRFRPEVVVVSDPSAAGKVRRELGGRLRGARLLEGGDALERLASHPEADTVICGMVGGRGLLPLVAALRAGKTVGLANKEALIVAGPLIRALSRKHKAPLIPVDSEHSAIYQCLQGAQHGDVKRLILTASGGPFYRHKGDLDGITVSHALDHPTWKMGRKITIDSATLMNKGLEAIEAHFLFDIPMDRISIVIHPQSIVHSLVEFEDGAMLAQLSHPDMRLPIQYALTHPDRIRTPIRPLDLADVGQLTFDRPDFSRFPCLRLALDAGRRGGTAPAVLSSANEVAVQAFLDGRVSFMTIPKVVSAVLRRHKVEKAPTLARVLTVDAWARREAADIISRQETRKK